MKQKQTTHHRKLRNQKEAGLSRTKIPLMRSSKDDYATDADHHAGNRRRANSSSKLFSDGEKVLAYHGLRIYEAKVQKSEIRRNDWKYFVHYLNWSKTWDEWVGAERLMKYTEDNILKQQALDKKQGVDRNSKTGRPNQTKTKISSDSKVDKKDVKRSGAKGKKRKNDSSSENEIESAENLMSIQIPSTLKKQLVDDWELVNERDKLVKLPCSPNIDEILAKYLEYRSKKDDMTMTDSAEEILKGLRCYFDRALPVILLYDKERQQYDELAEDDVSPSSIYGAEHLLRLFVKLPEILSYVNIEEDLVTCLQQQFLDILNFLLKNQSAFFISSYDGSEVSKTSTQRRKLTRA